MSAKEILERLRPEEEKEREDPPVMSDRREKLHRQDSPDSPSEV